MMGQHYSDPRRASDPHALPNVEVFHIADGDGWLGTAEESEQASLEPGWYWWACFPGCLPDGDPVGPFATKAEAVADAQDNCDDEENVTDDDTMK
jgi:hypothetical protein